MKYSVYCLIIVCIAVLTSCNDDPSLEKYIIKNQDDSAFMTLDVPAGLFIQEKNMDGMPEDVQRAIKSVKKANVIALPLDDGNKKRMEEEMAEMDEILSDKKYKRLLNLNVKGKMIRLMYSGEKDDMDEIVIYGKDPEKGFGIARLLGDGMNAKAITTIMTAAEKNQLDFNGDAFSGLNKLMEKNYK